MFQILSFPFSTNAQDNNITFKHISVENGLSQSTVYCILQDGKGFMWFGTEDGLNKYDGYRFVIYKHDPLDSTSLSNNRVRALYEDTEGVLWVGTQGGGLNAFHRETEKFTVYKYNPNSSKSLCNDRVWSITEDETGVLWIGTEGGLCRMHRSRTSSDGGRIEVNFRAYKHDSSNPNSLCCDFVNSLCEDKTGILWVGTQGGGLNIFDRENESFAVYGNGHDTSKSTSMNSIRSIHEGRSGTLWVGTDDGLVRLTPYQASSKNERVERNYHLYRYDPDNPFSLSNNNVWSIYEDQSGTIWIGTDSGLNIFDRNRENFRVYKHEPDNPYSLSHERVWSIYEDEAGVMWIGTSDGLNTSDRHKKKFSMYKHEPGDPNSLSHNFVYSIYEDRSGVVWIGTFGGGLNRLDRKEGRFTVYKHESRNPHSLSNNIVRLICEDKAGVMWIGTEGGGLNRFDKEMGSFTAYCHEAGNPHSLSHNFVRSFYIDRIGTMWIGTSGGGLNRFNREKGTFTVYRHVPGNPGSLSHDDVLSIFEDRAGVLWIGTDGGLNRFDREKESFTAYKQEIGNPHSLSHNSIFSIYEDKAGELWIGTYGGGLNKFDRQKETFIHYTEKDGLPNNVIYGILEDDSGNLWLSTNKGLSKCNPNVSPKANIASLSRFRNYDVNDGLQSNEFNFGAYYKNKSGEMYFGGINGFNVFHPDSIHDNPFIPPIVVTDFKILNRSVDVRDDSPLQRHISITDHIVLNYKDYVFTFEFAALHYSSPEKNQYAYMLEGVDKDWIYTDATRRYATYTTLSGGEYTFRVKGSNSDGVWNKEGVSIAVKVTPPFWATVWFRLISIATIVSLVIMVYKMRTYNIKKRSRQLEEKIEKRTLELREAQEQLIRREKLATLGQLAGGVGHELRNPLGIISNAVYYLRTIHPSADETTKEYLNIISDEVQNSEKILSDLLDFSRIKSVEKEEIAISVLIDQVLQWKPAPVNINVNLEISPELPKVFVDPQQIYQVLTNLITNAYQSMHGGGALTIRTHSKDDTVQISIVDTGSGISDDHISKIFEPLFTAKAKGIGLGLAVSKNLIEANGGSIEVESEVGKGSTFTVILPAMINGEWVQGSREREEKHG